MDEFCQEVPAPTPALVLPSKHYSLLLYRNMECLLYIKAETGQGLLGETGRKYARNAGGNLPDVSHNGGRVKSIVTVTRGRWMRVM